MKIGVLMGGWSKEREISLLSGKRVFQSLQKQGYQAVSIDIDDRNVLGVLRDGNFDVAFIMLHGELGEDGTIQGLLETMGISYTGSGVLASALALNKLFSKRIFKAVGVRTPPYLPLSKILSIDHVKDRLVKTLGLPVVVKPVCQGSSIGVHIFQREEELSELVPQVQEEFGDLLFEKYIDGTIATVGILGTGEETRPLPILELVPKKSQFYDYEAKYTKGATQFVIPAHLPEGVCQKTQDVAFLAHKALGCDGFSRVDLMISREGETYVLEVNTVPGMTELSNLPAEAEAAEISYDELVFEILCSAVREGKGR